MSSKPIYCVYKHTSPSGKSYIGQTYDYEDRSYRHQLKSSGCRAFYLAIQKYGWDSFTHEILYDNLTLDQANWREQQSINEYGCMVPCGYNLLEGGTSRSPSEETRRKISATTTGRKRKPDTPEMLALKSQRNLGKTVSVETREKMSRDRTGVIKDAVSRAKTSASLKGTTKPNRNRPVIQLSLAGEYVCTYSSAAVAYKTTGIRLSLCLNGKMSSAGGFKWVYA